MNASRLVESLKRINAPPPAEESKLLRLSVLTAVMAAVAGVVGAGVGSVRLGTLALLGVPLGHAISYLGRHRPGYVRKALLATAATVAFAKFLLAAASHVAGSPELRVPLGELFLWIQLLHSFDLPSRRDLLFTLLSSLSLVLVGGVLSTSPAFGLLLGLWALGSLVALILAHRSQQAELPRLGLAAGRSSGANLPAAWQAAVAVVLVGVWTAVTFSLLPPPETRRSEGLAARIADAVPVPEPGGLSNPTLDRNRPAGTAGSGGSGFGYFGFSRSLDLASRGRPDATPVMRVRASRPDFWRGQSFDRWDGRRWTISNEQTTPIGSSFGGPQSRSATSALEVPASPEDRPLQYLGRPLVQTFYLQTPGPNLLYGAYRADQLFVPFGGAYALDDGSVRTGVQMGPGTVYSVVSRRPPVTESLLRGTETLGPPGFAAAAAERLPATFVDRYTQLPDTTPSRVRTLAAEVTAGADNTYDKVRALEAWMGANTTYTLGIPPLPPGADAVEQFLFVDRKGFCEQIGTSLVVMLRSLGVPARLTVGFTPGERNPFTGSYQVRASDAHAWAEVFFPGIGWQAFDPTASVPLAGDAVLPSTTTSVWRFLSARLPGPPSWAGTVVALLVGLPVLAVAVGRAFVYQRRRRSRSWAVICLERIQATGARRGRPRQPEETTREYIGALVEAGLATDDLREVASTLEEDLYSGESVGLDRRRSTESALAGALARRVTEPSHH